MRTLLIVSLISIALVPTAAAGGAWAGASSYGFGDCDDNNGYSYASNSAGASASTGNTGANAGAQTYCYSYYGYEYTFVGGYFYVEDGQTGNWAYGSASWYSSGSWCNTDVLVLSTVANEYEPLGCPAGGPPTVDPLLP